MMIKEIYPSIHCVYALNSRTLASTFLRPQEHYESPKYKDKIFTLKEYKKWFKKYNKEDTFTYYSSYVGFNVPDFAFEPFLEGKFNPLTHNEKTLINYVSNLTAPYYVIGVCVADSRFVGHLKHESAHALWYLNHKYRKYMLKQISQLEPKLIRTLQRKLRKHGYNKKMYKDEIHAYMVDTSNPDYLDLPEVKRMKKYYDKTYYKDILITDDII